LPGLMAEVTKKPNLQWCSGCRLPYNSDLNPAGCPRCARDPNFAQRVQLDRHREARKGRFAVFAGSTAALGWIVAGIAASGVLGALWLWDLTSTAIVPRGDALTGARFAMVISALSTVTYTALSVATFLGANLFAWIAMGVVVLDVLVNGVVAVSYQSQSAMYVLTSKFLLGAVFLRQLLKST
jgi:hypothetical protein